MSLRTLYRRYRNPLTSTDGHILYYNWWNKQPADEIWFSSYLSKKGFLDRYPKARFVFFSSLGSIKLLRMDALMRLAQAPHPTKRIYFNGENNPILVTHRDKPGVIAAVTQLMHWEYADLNISNFHLSRQSKGGEAMMTIEIDGQPPENLIPAIRKIEHVSNAILIRRI